MDDLRKELKRNREHVTLLESELSGIYRDRQDSIDDFNRSITSHLEATVSLVELSSDDGEYEERPYNFSEICNSTSNDSRGANSVNTETTAPTSVV